MNKSDKLSYFIAFFAGLIRYYDYALFGLSASSIASNFMPNAKSSDQLLNFFMILSLSVIARPFGSIIFGQISDRMGRVASVKITTLIAACCAVFIAFLPSYNAIGIFATILLILCRMMFIMSLAGEVDSIKIYISEKIGKKYRHVANGINSFTSQIGVLLAALMYHFTLSFEELDWLWRLNFVIGGVLGLIVFLLRNRLKESVYYRKNKTEIANDNFFEILSQNRLKFFLAVILQGGVGASYNFWLIFLSTFVANIMGFITKTDASKNNAILIAVYGLAAIFSGILADNLRATYKQILTGLILSLVATIIMQYFIYYQDFSFSLHVISVFLIPIYTIPIQIKLQSIFPTQIRVRMCSLSHSVGSMIFSASIPFFCMLLWKYTEMNIIIYLYFMVLLLLMIGGIIHLDKESYQNMFEDNNKYPLSS